MNVKNDYIVYKKIKNGFTGFVDERQPLIKKIKLGYLNLSANSIHNIPADSLYERVIVLLKGSFSVSFDGKKYFDIGPRVDFFNEKAWAVYVPLFSYALIKTFVDTEIILCSANADKALFPKIITPDDVRGRDVGSGQYSRAVYDIVGADFTADKIMVGETINPAGNWSSFPPHKHDIDNGDEEARLEEVYYFRINPENGFGFQRIYLPYKNIDEALVLKNHCSVMIPHGYHPVSASPGYSIYYLWVLAGDKRILKPYEDPNHSWVVRR